MFVIQVTSLENQVSKHYWINKNSDDFIRFLPNNFGVPKENLKFWMFDDSEFFIIENLLKSQNENEERFLDLSENSKIKVVKKVKAQIEVLNQETNETEIQEVDEITVLREVLGSEIAFPYDSSMNFLGNGHELEQGAL